MFYASIDIETSGLDSENNCVLSIGVIVEDTNNILPFEEIPKFNAIIIQNQISGHPRAITMNREIIEHISDYISGDDTVRKMLTEKTGYIFLTEHEVVEKLFLFLFEHGFGYSTEIAQTVQFINGKSFPLIGTKTKPIYINVAGKNFGTFDKLFLEKLPRWKQLIRIRQRILDPGILFCDWKNDEEVPSLSKCKKRAEIEGAVTHNALEDAWDVIQLLRKSYS